MPLLVTLVVLSADPAGCADPHLLRTAASASVDTDGTVTIRFPDGTSERVPPLSDAPTSPLGPEPDGTSERVPPLSDAPTSPLGPEPGGRS
ncbi:hypothetical protein [Streptomyces sp. ALI-76-A]|uniref:hypothetical protein n=1 Tax=Streptomyces sp. ALI-76-A TaxID=3025736 RepID=UPI0033651761